MSDLTLDDDDNFTRIALALNEVTEGIHCLLKDKVAAVMREHGEDPGHPGLLALRVHQAAWSLESVAQRENEKEHYR